MSCKKGKSIPASRCTSSQETKARQKDSRACHGNLRRISGKKKPADDKKRDLLKVKLPNRTKLSLSKGISSLEVISGNTSTHPKVAEMCCEPDEDPYVFSPNTQTKTPNYEKKARLSVLRTISKMVEENQLIRKRLASLKQIV